MLFGHRALDDLQFAFATGESLAHLNHLIGSGQLTRTARADGVWLYCRA